MKKVTNLADIAKAEFRNHPIQIRCIISGKNTTPYSVPKTINIKCTSLACPNCKYRTDAGKNVKLEATDERVLLFIDTALSTLHTRVKQAFRLRCKSFNATVVESQNILRIFISQLPGGLSKTKWVGERVAYYTGHDIGTNTTYLMTGYQTSDPKTQVVTWVFTNAKKTKTDVESFELSAKTLKELRAFRLPVELEDAKEIFPYLYDELYKTYALNVTKIYDRPELHMAIDLIFHSALKFRLGHGKIVPAWLDVIVLGDTRCGKGHVAEGLVNYYGIGEVISGENCTYAGLVGGVQQIDKHWVVTWGRIPVNDQGMVVVDEASNLRTEDWAKLSRIRSEGIAEVVKIQHQAVNSRTRLLFLSNPPSRAMSTYSYGIEALPDLVPAPEDIARFDFAFIVTNRDVNLESINTDWSETRFKFSQELERQLIMWIWSRKPHQIKFTDEAMAYLYVVSNKTGGQFDITIPLIQGENVRYKIGKIAIAFAGRFFSASKDGDCLIVKQIHIECAILFLRTIYKLRSNGYFEYSQQRQKENPELSPKDIKDLERYFKSYKMGATVIFNYFLNNNTMNTRELKDFMGVSEEVSTEAISLLLQKHFILRKGPNFYVKTANFTEYLRQRQRDKRATTGKV